MAETWTRRGTPAAATPAATRSAPSAWRAARYLTAALMQDADEKDHGVGALHRDIDRGLVAHVDAHRHDLADIAHRPQEGGRRVAHRDPHHVAARGQSLDDVAADEARAAEHRHASRRGLHQLLLRRWRAYTSGCARARHCIDAAAALGYSLRRFGGDAAATARARVAELVDALDSGSSDRKVVEVQVFSRAPTQRAGAAATLTHRARRVPCSRVGRCFEGSSAGPMRIELHEGDLPAGLDLGGSSPSTPRRWGSSPAATGCAWSSQRRRRHVRPLRCAGGGYDAPNLAALLADPRRHQAVPLRALRPGASSAAISV